MTEEQIQEYISENDPDTINKDELGRWTERIWQLENSKIVESYEYKHGITKVQSDPLKYRDSFAVKSVTRKEVNNG